MSQDIISFLKRVLSIVGYEDDKDAFINEFIDMCMLKALIDYAYLLPVARRVELLKILKTKQLGLVKEQIEPYLMTEEYQTLFQKHTRELFQDYLKTIMRVLSEEQKNKLYTFFASYNATVKDEMPSQKQVSSPDAK